MNTPETYQSRYFDDTKNKSSSFFVVCNIWVVGELLSTENQGLHMGGKSFEWRWVNRIFHGCASMFECDICEDMELKIGLLAKREKIMY
jgi:hypothetical protein